MKTISLTQGRVALVDDEDFERVNAKKWYCAILHGKPYAIRCVWQKGKKKTVYMHRFILGTSSVSVDHIDNNGLNNQKANLRACKHRQNMRNRKLNYNSTSGFKGVTMHRLSGPKRFRAQIGANGIKKALGCFQNSVEAAIAYDRAAVAMFGEFAKTNQSLGLLPAQL